MTPAAGIGLQTGALLGTIRTTDGTIDANLATARTRNQLLAAAGTALLVAGLAISTLRHV